MAHHRRAPSVRITGRDPKARIAPATVAARALIFTRTRRTRTVKKRGVFLFVAACLLLSATSLALAQEQAPSGPPKVLQIFREEVKPGKAPAHEKVEAGWPRAFANASSPTHYIAMVSVTGPSEAW